MSASPPARPDPGDHIPLIFLVAGEPSGDLLGAYLMDALETATGGRVRFAGIGGREMERRGMHSRFPMSDLAVMGFAEILPRLPRLLRRIATTAAVIRQLAPDAIVTIDSPGFCLRVAKRIRRLGIPVVHYVAPSVWAYAPWRAKRVARVADHLMALLPFEPPYFEAVGLPCTYVGHPVAEYVPRQRDGGRFRARHGIPRRVPLVAVLPGSRHSETSRLLPVFADALRRLKARFPKLRAVVPTVPTVAAEVAAAAARWPVPAVVVHESGEKYDAFAASDAALAASGTASVELAVCGVPHVVAYRVNAPTAFIARRLRRIDYASLVNLAMDRAVVPEFLQEDCTGAKLADALARLLSDEEAGEAQRADLAEALARLGIDGDKPSGRAAEVVLRVIGHRAARAEIQQEERHGQDRRS